MLKNIIIIEKNEKFECNTEQELVKKIICENYYELSQDERNKALEQKAVANSIGNQFEVVEKNDVTRDMEVKNKFILLDEKTYILSLLMTNNITLLEHINSNMFIKYLNKENFTKNYIIVNNFACNILKSYLKEAL